MRTYGLRQLVSALAAIVALAVPAAAQDKVKVGVFPVSSSLPYFVAVERGYFKEQNIEPEMVRLIGGPPNVAAMITNQIDVSAVLVTIEGMRFIDFSVETGTLSEKVDVTKYLQTF
jgi:NitT/TauT family transport system substrate-binding protein